MKIGASTYSWRKTFKNCTPPWGSWQKLKESFPQITGLEILNQDLIKFMGDVEIEDLLTLKENLQIQGEFEWFALTTDSLEFGANTVPYWADYQSYIKGFEQTDEWRIMGGKEWIDYATQLDIPCMRIDIGTYVMNHKIPYTDALEFNTKRFIKVFSALAEYAKAKGIQLGFENHGGFASDEHVISTLLDAVPDLCLTLDLGNFPDHNRYELIEQFAPRTNFVHAKTCVFDENGEEKHIDYEKCLQILKDSGFEGWLSIEYEGPDSEEQGIKQTIALIEKYL